MKKLALIFFILIFGMATLYYFLAPSPRIFQSCTVAVNAKGFARNIKEDKNWKMWWPGEAGQSINENIFELYYHNYAYQIIEKKLTSILIKIKNNRDSFLTELLFIPTKPDSVSLSWEGKSLSGRNPFQLYAATKKINQDLETILNALQRFYSSEENIYGIRIQKEHVADSMLISTSLTTKGYPSTAQIYELIDKLKAHAATHAASQTGLPMLNITTFDSLRFLTRVALPLNKKLSDEGAIVYRWMLGGGNIIVTEVKGGPGRINQAFNELENYVQDHERVAPAIPFQSLVTDRRKEPDSSKWITKVYWPVM